ncbi:hypothetical protein FOA52_013488 [Chlamydomonas sp. UWO 241]|nr:hypothetical protein FOA52_013488 [Chlamydomonas sp. UWO 241]
MPCVLGSVGARVVPSSSTPGGGSNSSGTSRQQPATPTANTSRAGGRGNTAKRAGDGGSGGDVAAHSLWCWFSSSGTKATPINNTSRAGERGSTTNRAGGGGSGGDVAAHSLWCWISVGFALILVARHGIENGFRRELFVEAALILAYIAPFVAILGHLPPAACHLPRRAWNAVFWVVSVPLFGHVPTGVCTLMRTGMDIPFFAIIAWIEPLGASAWWVRAAILLPLPQLLMLCACSSGQRGVGATCTREAWGTLSGQVNLVAFVALRAGVPLAVKAAVWWWQVSARRGGKAKQE